MMRSLKEAGDLNGKRVLVRVDWNVPIVDGEVRDDFRIRKSLPTLEFLKSAGAKVIICTHLEPEDLTVEALKKYVPGGAELLENLRKNPGEKSNSLDFAKELASLADIFVNEAFSESHRKYASIVGVPKFIPSFLGLGFEKEIQNLSKAFNPSHPFLFILGGAKFETKLPLVEKFLSIADEIFIAGANAKPAFDAGFSKYPKISFPNGDMVAPDADENVISQLSEKIEKSSFILWNGPLGVYEQGYKEGTIKLAQILAQSGKEVIVGGGDTLTTIKEQDLLSKFTFVSSGGGAMLDFLANGTLPGIEALG
ncbi:MAG: phosphoglycerate kinase [Patescibacteria group bacterium]|mgnify:CR=1 FL=1